MTRLKRSLLTRGAALLAMLPFGCQISTPFQGPGFDRKRGVTADAAGATVFVSLTHAVLDPQTRGPFDDQIDRIHDRLDEQPGLIGHSIGKQLFGTEVFTMSVWVDEAAHDRFVASPLHREAMKAGAPAVLSMRTVTRALPAALIPLPWNQAFALLDAEGRPPEYQRRKH